MTRPLPDGLEAQWTRFVIEHGHGARICDLAFILGRQDSEIQRLRATGACRSGGHRKGFAELFHLWHGREPGDGDWPPPRRSAHGGYEWQAPELALLASLVGRLPKKEIAQVLTERLRQVASDTTATRSHEATQIAINKMGLQSTDVTGGITVADAGREAGSTAIVNQAIRKGDLKATRVGRLWVIPYDNWSEWKKQRVFPPAGFVPLSSMKAALCIRSDKLSEFARMGHVPTAIRCSPYGTGQSSTQFGTWYVDKQVADTLVADRQAGLPMPWHGKPMQDNMRATYRLWRQRRHPPSCKTCTAIWGPDGAPATIESYAERYPPLAYGAKRHLTKPWAPGLTVADVARQAGRSPAHIRLAITNGTLRADDRGRKPFIARTDATRWISHGCPSGNREASWISLETARSRYLFTGKELDAFIADGALKTKHGTQGAARGIVYVAKAQCARLREEVGFTEEDAARRAGISVQHLREALKGVDWRGTAAIPLATLKAVIGRLRSSPGHTIKEAAGAVGKEVAWVQDRIKDGTVRLLRGKPGTNRPYLSEPMMRRLREALDATELPARAVVMDGLRLGEAAREAGVTASTVIVWAKRGELCRVPGKNGWRYPRDAVRTRARDYWRTVRLHRATPPSWLKAEAEC